MFGKNEWSGFGGKGFQHKLNGGVKGLARFLDEPIVKAGISSFAPEVVVGLAAAKKIWDVAEDKR